MFKKLFKDKPKKCVVCRTKQIDTEETIHDERVCKKCRTYLFEIGKPVILKSMFKRKA